MTAVPLQYFGLGDNIFTVALMNKFIERGYDVTYPVLPQNVEALQRAYPRINWVDYKTSGVDFERRGDYVQGDKHFLPIRFAEHLLGKPYKYCMRAKYDLYGFDWQDWRTAMYQRDKKKEKFLFNNTSQLMNGRPYTLVSRHFGSGSQYKADIRLPKDDMLVVELKKESGYSLFDWSYIIENATYIHAASSSILYLLELLDLKAKEVHLYARKPIEPHFDNVGYIFTKDYKLHL